MEIEKQALNLLISIDDNYIIHAKDLIYSIMINNNVYLKIFLIYGDNLSNKSIEELSNYLESNKYGELRPIYFKNQDALPIYIDYISITTYFRLFAPFMLKDDIDRILYLDCDIICNGSIVDFYNTDFEGNTIIGCKNILSEKYIEWEPKINIRIGLPADYQYINAGVLLINIPNFVNSVTAEGIIEFIKENAEFLGYQDQDVINKLFCDKIKLADKIYNFQINPIDDDSEYSNARLVHYSEKLKPWDVNYDKPSKAIFYYELLKNKNELDELKELIFEQHKNMALNLYNKILKGDPEDNEVEESTEE